MFSNGFQRARLKDVCDRITVGHVGPMAEEYSSEGVPFLRSQNINPFKLDLRDLKFIPRDFHNKLSKSALRPGDVAVVRTGYPGTACVIPPAFAELNCADLVIIRPSKKLNAFFLTAIFNSVWGMATVAGNLVGVAQQHFNVGAAREMEITLPSRAIQDRIAAVLSAYCDLIENNTRRIQVLERMAQAIYREWFVNFRFPGHAKVQRVTSPLGPIPQGWRATTLGEMADVSWGDTSTTKSSYVDEGFDAYSASGLDGKLDHFDFDRKGIVLSAIGAHCGRTWFARGKWSCIKNTIRFWAKSEAVSDEYLFLATMGTNFWPRRGAAQPFISQGDAMKLNLLCPDRATMQAFTELACDQLELIATLERKNNNLRRTRDLLLPKLLSGTLSVENLAMVEIAPEEP